MVRGVHKMSGCQAIKNNAKAPSIAVPALGTVALFAFRVVPGRLTGADSF